MSQSDTLAIVTRRLVLRDFVDEDLADVHAFRSDPEIARFMDFHPESLDESRSWLNGAILHNRKKLREAFNLAILLQTENRAFGWIGIGRSERYPREGELGFGYALHRAYWGQGYATEAAQAILCFGFRALGGRRISAWCYSDNVASARVLEKAGLRFERRYWATEPKSGQPAECLEYVIRVDEWQA